MSPSQIQRGEGTWTPQKWKAQVSIESVHVPPANLEVWLQPTRIPSMVFCLVRFSTSGGNSTGEGCFKLGTMGEWVAKLQFPAVSASRTFAERHWTLDVWDDHFQKFWIASSNPTKKWVFFSLAKGLGSSQAFTALLDNSKERAVQIIGGGEPIPESSLCYRHVTLPGFWETTLFNFIVVCSSSARGSDWIWHVCPPKQENGTGRCGCSKGWKVSSRDVSCPK